MVLKYKLDSSFRFATFRMTLSACHSEEGYVSKCSELRVASCGDMVEEAVSNLKEAVGLYLENARKLGIMQDK